MKTLYLLGTLACMSVALSSNCQSSTLPVKHTPEKSFNQLPDKISCPESTLKNIFSASVNNNLRVDFGSSFKIEGTVVAKTIVAADQISINIRCNNFKNAMLNISKLTQPNGTISYVGRIASPHHGDVLLLWEENGQYTFIRQKQLLAMVE